MDSTNEIFYIRTALARELKTLQPHVASVYKYVPRRKTKSFPCAVIEADGGTQEGGAIKVYHPTHRFLITLFIPLRQDGSFADEDLEMAASRILDKFRRVPSLSYGEGKKALNCEITSWRSDVEENLHIPLKYYAFDVEITLQKKIT